MSPGEPLLGRNIVCKVQPLRHGPTGLCVAMLSIWMRCIVPLHCRSYGEYVAHQFDTYARIGLIITYIIIVLVIFVVASSQSQDAARLHVFES